MASKDYYHILQIEPNADLDTIKKAYRRLAMEYHPDRSASKTESDAGLFLELKEAYDILSVPSKREEYHYERWLHQSMGLKMQGHQSAYQIYQNILEFEQYLSGIDQFRKNHYTLLNLLLTLFNIQRIQSILAEKNTDLEEKIIIMAMKMTEGLNSVCEIQLKERLKTILDKHPLIHDEWMKNIDKKIKEERYAKLTKPLIILIVIIACIMFYFFNKS
jgi:DnaJ-class molecular chaperone